LKFLGFAFWDMGFRVYVFVRFGWFLGFVGVVFWVCEF
jgi:hypothetical protein